jgi:hypothetical protein
MLRDGVSASLQGSELDETITMKANEIVDYMLRIDKLRRYESGLKGGTNVAKALSIGKYEISVILPLISASGNSSRIVRSDRIEVLVSDTIP